MTRKLFVSLVTAALLLAGAAAPALANDHLANAISAPGAAHRGFVNPVAANPSGTSGANAAPGTVPGEGDPKAGGDLGTPSVDLGLVSVRSGGHGDPQKP